MKRKQGSYGLLRALVLLFACSLGPQVARAQDYTVTNLGSTSSWVEPKGINASGQVVFYNWNGSEYQTFFYDGATAQDIGSFGGSYTFPSGLNASGQVVGYALTSTGEVHAFSWTQAGGMVDLGTLGGTDSYAYGVNASGQVVGYGRTSTGAVHVFSWTQAGGMVDLNLHIPSAPAGMELFYGLAVSDNGSIVAYANTGTVLLGGSSVTVSDFFLHGTGATANPSTLFLDGTTPTATTAKSKDSAAIKFSGGNSWKEIGTWEAQPALSSGTLSALSNLVTWIGLKNSDDQGTWLDLRAEVYQNQTTLVASGEILCIQGVTRNANQAKEVAVSFNSPLPMTFDGTTDELSLRVLTRIGTNGSGAFCGGHSSAVGLRLYFDAVSRPSKFAATFNQ